VTNQPVYVVKDNCCGGCGNVHAVFSTRPAADAYVTSKQPHTSHDLLIEEHDLDTPSDHLLAG
jgi:hypothetical protein